MKFSEKKKHSYTSHVLYCKLYPHPSYISLDKALYTAFENNGTHYKYYYLKTLIRMHLFNSEACGLVHELGRYSALTVLD